MDCLLSESSSKRQTSAPARQHHLVVHPGHVCFSTNPLARRFLPRRRLSISTCRPRPLHSLLTNQGLPLPIGLCDLIGAAHLAERHAADDEDDDAGPGAVLPGRLVLVPVAVASAAGPGRSGQDDTSTQVTTQLWPNAANNAFIMVKNRHGQLMTVGNDLILHMVALCYC